MLNDRQLRNLVRIAENWVKEIEVEATALSLGETAFTGEILLPWLQKKVSTLLKPELYVRGDGGPPIQPLNWEGITFYPDLAVVSVYEKYLAFEVKILRDSDPGGALTKAIGQTSLYSRLGYTSTFGLIFDQRTSVARNEIVTWKSEILEQDASHVHYYF
jgi:hypothetical protein